MITLSDLKQNPGIPEHGILVNGFIYFRPLWPDKFDSTGYRYKQNDASTLEPVDYLSFLTDNWPVDDKLVPIA